MEVLSGAANSVRHTTETQGQIHGSGGRVNGSVSTSHVCTLRVGDVPARIKLPGATNLNDGDVVTLVGARKADGFQGYVLRNETTGTVHSPPAWPLYVGGGLALALGIPLSFIIIGLPFLFIGAYAVWLGVRQSKALGQLKITPSPQRVS